MCDWEDVYDFVAFRGNPMDRILTVAIGATLAFMGTARADFVWCYATGVGPTTYLSGVFQSSQSNLNITAAFTRYLEANGIRAGGSLCPSDGSQTAAVSSLQSFSRGRAVMQVPFSF